MKSSVYKMTPAAMNYLAEEGKRKEREKNWVEMLWQSMSWKSSS